MSQSSGTEHWLPVPGAEGYYEVSDHGRVRSLNRTITRCDGRKMRCWGRDLKPWIDEHGRLSVSICAPDKPNSPNRIRISRLALLAFVGPAPEGTEGCHNDGDVSNNRIDNLRWDTHSANGLDRVRHGRDPGRNKTHCPRNHVLAEPNLEKAHWTKGFRTCLSCSWASSTLYGEKGKKYSWSFKEIADEYYARIMGLPGNSEILLPVSQKKRTHCPREHPLAHPNLVPSGLKRGKRICLACQRAHCVSYNAQIRGGTIDLKATSDRYYAQIMRNALE